MNELAIPIRLSYIHMHALSHSAISIIEVGIGTGEERRIARWTIISHLISSVALFVRYIHICVRAGFGRSTLRKWGNGGGSRSGWWIVLDEMALDCVELRGN